MELVGVVKRKKETVREYLLRQLVRGDYRFGDKISAKEISEETGASRFMVVSALNELRAEGFLEITAQVGCKVVYPTIRECTDFFIMFGRLEGVLAEFAAERRTEGDIAEMRSINDRLRKIKPSDPDAGEDYRTINLAFHHILHQAADSPMLAQRQEMHWMMVDFFVTQARDFREHTVESADEHEVVISAIERGDAPTARALMEAHIRRLGEDVANNLQMQESLENRRGPAAA